MSIHRNTGCMVLHNVANKVCIFWLPLLGLEVLVGQNVFLYILCMILVLNYWANYLEQDLPLTT